MTAPKMRHPTACLYEGEVTEARPAIEAYIRGLEYERGVCAQLIREAPPRDDAEREQAQKDDAQWATWIESAKKCLADYDRQIGEAEKRLFAEWKESDDSTRRDLGEAGLAQDWSRIAI